MRRLLLLAAAVAVPRSSGRLVSSPAVVNIAPNAPDPRIIDLAPDGDCGGGGRPRGAAALVLPEAPDEALPDACWLDVTFGAAGEALFWSSSEDAAGRRWSVDLATRAGFRREGGVRGMFYDGDLTIGAHPLLSEYGPPLRDGDRCVMECQRRPAPSDAGEGPARRPPPVTLTVFVNGRRVGRAFDVENASGTHYYPCVAVVDPRDETAGGRAARRGSWTRRRRTCGTRTIAS